MGTSNTHKGTSAAGTVRAARVLGPAGVPGSLRVRALVAPATLAALLVALAAPRPAAAQAAPDPGRSAPRPPGPLRAPTTGPAGVAATRPAVAGPATRPREAEDWTVVLFWDNLGGGERPDKGWEKIDEDLKAHIRKQAGVRDARTNNPGPDSKLEPASFGDLLFDLEGLVPHRDPNSVWSRPYTWVFEVEAPPWSRVTLADAPGFVIDPRHEGVRVTPKGGSAPRLGNQDVVQTWQVEVSKAPVFPRKARLGTAAEVTLADGTALPPQVVRVGVRLSDEILSLMRIRVLTIYYQTEADRSTAVRLFEAAGAVGFRVKEPILFLPVSAIPEPLAGVAQSLAMATPPGLAGPYYHVAIREGAVGPDRDPVPLTGSRWRLCKREDRDWYVEATPGADANKVDGFHFWRVERFGDAQKHRTLVLGKTADGFDVRVLHPPASGERPQKVELGQEWLEKAWAQAQKAAGP